VLQLLEVFKCYDEDLYWYDVNSLYPFSMLKPMPGGNMFRSNDNNLNNYFGVCFASISVPDNIYNPILPYRDKNGMNYNPVGSWKGWYCSEILQEAVALGISVNVHHGYKFNKVENLFDNYIKEYYLRKNNAKLSENKGVYHLSKLMLNSLYGRMGLKFDLSNTEVVPLSKGNDISLKYRVLDKCYLDENFEYIKYIKMPSSSLIERDIELQNKTLLETHLGLDNDIVARSIPLAIFTTAYATIFMHKFLNLTNNKCIYSDTDSIFLKKPLEDKYIGNGLGQFKFEGKIKKGYFISPKLYCLITDNGETLIKSKGVDSEKLKVEDFLLLLEGKDIKVPSQKFNTNWNDFNVNMTNLDINLSPKFLKREFVDSNRMSSETKPLKIENNEIIWSNKLN